MNPPAPTTSQRLPVAALATVLLAWLALFITARGLPLLLVCAVAVVIATLTETRLRVAPPLRWVIRLVLLSVVVLATPTDPATAYDQFGTARARNIFGLGAAALAAFQFWRRYEDGPARTTALLSVLFLSGVTFLAAANTYEDRWIRLIAPFYILSLTLAARQWKPRAAPANPAEAAGARTVAWLCAASFLGALILGAGGYRVATAFRGNLNDLTNRLLRDNFDIETTGMSAQPMLGPIFGLRGSAARVLRIEGDVLATNPHLRGAAFDTYDHGTWGPSVAERAYEAASLDTLHPPRADRVPVTQTADLRVSRLVNDNPLLYAPLNTTLLDPGTDTRGLAWARASGGPIRLRARAPFEYTVTVTTQNETYQGLLANALTPETRTRCLALPAENADITKVSALARQVVGGAKSDRAKIEAVGAYLLTHHKYSLEFRPSGKQDPVADFLLSDPPKDAHCEFFAASAALMLRAAGVPTRYVTGYYAHEGDGAGRTVVRQRDAHAWCEAWVEGVGWVTVDDTPGDGRPDASTEKVEAWRVLWEKWQDAGQALTEWLGNLTPTQINTAIATLLFVLGGLALLRWLMRRRRRQAPTLPAPPRLYPSPEAALLALSARFEAAWEKGGGPPFAPNRSYPDFLRRLPAPVASPPADPTGGVATVAAPPALTPAFIALARQGAALRETARFGGLADPDTLNQLEKIVQQMEETTL